MITLKQVASIQEPPFANNSLGLGEMDAILKTPFWFWCIKQ